MGQHSARHQPVTEHRLAPGLRLMQLPVPVVAIGRNPARAFLVAFLAAATFGPLEYVT